METPTPRRKFTIVDGMILVAAMALALADFGLFYMNITWEFFEFPTSRKQVWVWLVFSIALVLIRLRRPRPGRDDLWRQPGWVACASVAIAVVVLAIFYGQVITLPLIRPGASQRPAEMLFREFLRNLPFQVMLVVVAAWGILALGGRWRAEPCWIDRAGRLIGLGWIALTLKHWLWLWSR